jgi:hypothetical protein
VRTGVQWTGSLNGGEARRWFSSDWPAASHMVWYVVPTTPVTGAPQLDWDVEVERASADRVTYWITVRNLTGAAVTFEGRYTVLD